MFNPVVQAGWDQSSARYSIRNRGAQCVANSAMFFLSSTLKPVHEMNTFNLNTILDDGDNLYNEIRREIPNTYLMISEVPREIILDNQVFGIYPTGTLMTLMVDRQKLKIALENVFEKGDKAFFTCRDLTTAMIYENNKFYIFDSHSRGSNGFFANFGTAVLIQFDSLNELVDHLFGMYYEKNNYVTYEITTVYVEQLHVVDIPYSQKVVAKLDTIIRNAITAVIPCPDLNISRPSTSNANIQGWITPKKTVKRTHTITSQTDTPKTSRIHDGHKGSNDRETDMKRQKISLHNSDTEMPGVQYDNTSTPSGVKYDNTSTPSDVYDKCKGINHQQTFVKRQKTSFGFLTYISPLAKSLKKNLTSNGYVPYWNKRSMAERNSIRLSMAAMNLLQAITNHELCH